MRRLAAVALLLALVCPASAAALEWTPHVARAAKWAGDRQGSVTFAVRTEDRLWGRGLDRQVPSASVFKAMLLVTYLRRSSVRHRALTDDDRALLRPMIRRSDNVAATRVRDIVGNAAVVRLARRAGMTRFAIADIWGMSLDHRARPVEVPPAHRAAAPGAPPRLRAEAAAHDRPVAALGDGAGDPRGLDAVLQGRLGVGDRRRRPPGRPAGPRGGPRRDRGPHRQQPVARLRQGDAAGRLQAPGRRLAAPGNVAPCCACGCSASWSSNPAVRPSRRPPAAGRGRCSGTWRCTRGRTRAPRSPRGSGRTCSTRARARACAARWPTSAARWAREHLIATREAAGLDGEPWTDAAAFAALVAEGRDAEALELCRGDLLAGLDDDWIVAARDEHREAQGAALARLADAADAEEAARLARARIALDPLSEDAHRDLMKRLAAAGDRAAALAVYNRLAERLRTELRIAPSAADAGARGVAARDAPERPPLPARARPAPRPQPVRRPRRAARAPAGRRGGRRAAAAGDQRRPRDRQDAAAGRAGARRSRRRRHGALRALAGGGRRALPAVRRGAAPARLRATPGWRRCSATPPRATRPARGCACSRPSPPRSPTRPAGRCCSRSTTCTGPTCRRCGCSPTCCATPARPGVVVVGTYRETELGRGHPLARALADLRRDRLVERIALAGLDGDAASGLISGWVGAERGAGLSAAVQDETGGNPFFIEEVLHHLLESGALAGDGRRSRSATSACPRACAR